MDLGQTNLYRMKGIVAFEHDKYKHAIQGVHNLSEFCIAVVVLPVLLFASAHVPIGTHRLQFATPLLASLEPQRREDATWCLLAKISNPLSLRSDRSLRCVCLVILRWKQSFKYDSPAPNSNSLCHSSSPEMQHVNTDTHTHTHTQ